MTLDWEAVTLRATAQIKDLLSDGESHYWSECVDVARELTAGNRPAAGRVAWKALTAYLDELHVVWGGPKGQRWLAVYDEATITARIGCPVCDSEAGEPCVRMNGKGRTATVKAYPHDERQVAAYEPTDVSGVLQPA